MKLRVVGRRSEPISSATVSRDLSRAGLWATGSRQLTLPVVAEGLSERASSNIPLRLCDYDPLAWICERWLRRPTDTGWMRPSLYELGSDLYGRAPGGREYELLCESLDRLHAAQITLLGYDSQTGTYAKRVVSKEHLLERLTLPRDDPNGLDRFGVKLGEWVREQLDHGNPLRLNWRVLRSFSYQQRLAKRLWIYLAAERWKREGETEATWIAVGDRLFAALGMEYERPRDARRALKRACPTVAEIDPRLDGGEVYLRKLGRRWQLVARRPTERVWAERRKIRAQARESLGLAA